ncbi:MAG: GFA family protein [Proteobacteria bacterium]|nr:GFA family protein [Pseudomonadota bacterium]
MKISGECFCGQVSYSINGPLQDARSCHCSRCRKAFSSQASAYALVDPENFRWETGEDLLTLFQNQHGFGLKFCSLCGSTLCGVFQGIVHGITLGCVNGDPDVEIGRHIYVGSKAGWEVMPQNVLQFEEAAPIDA